MKSVPVVTLLLALVMTSSGNATSACLDVLRGKPAAQSPLTGTEASLPRMGGKLVLVRAFQRQIYLRTSMTLPMAVSNESINCESRVTGIEVKNFILKTCVGVAEGVEDQ